MTHIEYCDHCGDDFRYDDTGGYNPPCQCRLNCRSCCEHGACDREDGQEDGCDICGRSWTSCSCDTMDEALAADAEKIRALGGDPGRPLPPPLTRRSREASAVEPDGAGLCARAPRGQRGDVPGLCARHARRQPEVDGVQEVQAPLRAS
jgi:hypothetical protein